MQPKATCISMTKFVCRTSSDDTCDIEANLIAMSKMACNIRCITDADVIPNVAPTYDLKDVD